MIWISHRTVRTRTKEEIKMKLRTKTLVVSLALAVVAAACGGDDEPAPASPAPTAAPAPTEAPAPAAPGTIVDVATEAGSFGTLLAAVEAAGLVDTLLGEGPFTVFAPTDDAFAKLPEGTVESLLNDIPALTDILLYHVVAGEVLAADVVNLESATSVQGSDIAISVDGGNVFLNGEAQVVATDIAASNGVIHVIDTVILPPSN
jgi:uncharacterized surface protein with fasciclin (FAS1) repeats